MKRVWRNWSTYRSPLLVINMCACLTFSLHLSSLPPRFQDSLNRMKNEPRIGIYLTTGHVKHTSSMVMLFLKFLKYSLDRRMDPDELTLQTCKPVEAWRFLWRLPQQQNFRLEKRVYKNIRQLWSLKTWVSKYTATRRGRPRW